MELMELVIARVRNRFPALKVYAFGTERKPSFLRKNEYWRSPSVDKARELYNRSIIWLLTSHTEGLPGSALESMSCGTPVISTDNDGSREIVRHMKNGILVPRGKADTFIPAIQHLLSDPDLWRNISNGAMSTAAGFTWQRAVDKMESVLWSLQKNVKGDEQIVEESIS
jgi:glycosyltransferase involved in cell wall biosynthesis